MRLPKVSATTSAYSEDASRLGRNGTTQSVAWRRPDGARAPDAARLRPSAQTRAAIPPEGAGGRPRGCDFAGAPGVYAADRRPQRGLAGPRSLFCGLLDDHAANSRRRRALPRLGKARRRPAESRQHDDVELGRAARRRNGSRQRNLRARRRLGCACQRGAAPGEGDRTTVFRRAERRRNGRSARRLSTDRVARLETGAGVVGGRAQKLKSPVASGSLRAPRFAHWPGRPIQNLYTYSGTSEGV